jgi:Ca2+-binding EF-hand superfamily protein
MPTTPALINHIMKKIDKDGSGDISLEDFMQFSNEQDVKLKKVFDKIDTEQTGYLVKHEVATAMRKFNKDATKDMIDTLFSKMDKDKSGIITYDEFILFFYLLPEESMRATFDHFVKGRIDIGESMTIPEERHKG